MASFLDAIFDDIGDALSEGFGSSVNALRELSQPEQFENRAELAEAMEEVFGYDPTGYFDEKETVEFLRDEIESNRSSIGEDVDDEKIASMSDSVLAAFNQVRPTILEIGSHEALSANYPGKIQGKVFKSVNGMMGRLVNGESLEEVEDFDDDEDDSYEDDYPEDIDEEDAGVEPDEF